MFLINVDWDSLQVLGSGMKYEMCVGVPSGGLKWQLKYYYSGPFTEGTSRVDYVN